MGQRPASRLSEVLKLKSPKALDPFAVANAQSASNRDTAITQQLLNMTGQITPYGNLSYNQSGESSYTDAQGNVVKTPTFTSTTSISPNQQQILQQNEQADLAQNKIALSQIDRIGTHLSTPFKADNAAVEGRINELSSKRLDPMWQQREGEFEQTMANKGISAGSEAYNNSRRNFDYGKNDAYNSMLLSGRGQSINELLTERNQPMAEIASLMGNSQPQMPTFQNTPTTGVAGTDIAGLINNQYQGKQQNYQAMMGGLSGLGSAALGGWFGA
jgi:hypothetical protein